MVFVDLVMTYLRPSNKSLYMNLTMCIRNLNGLDDDNVTGTPVILGELIEESAIHNTSSTLHECLRELLPPYYYSSRFLMPLWQRVSWSVIFSLMLAVAAIGNAIVIWIILAHRRMRNVTNYFLLNLALADLSMSLLNAVFNFVYLVNSDWTFGSAYCVINSFLSNLAISSSVFSISAMSVDRYFAIVYPLSPRMSRKSAVFVICLIWIGSSLLALPTALFSQTTTFRYPDGTLRTLCNLHWPDGIMGESQSDYIYNTVILIVNYILPMLCMAYTYIAMCSVLWGSKGIGVVTDRQRESIKSKQRVVRMLVTVVVIFASCWLPYHVYFLYVYYNPSVNDEDYIQHVFLAIYWFAMSNSMYNPIIYYTMNSRFRSYFHYILCFCRTSGPDENRGRIWTKNGRLVEFRKSFSSAQTSLRVTLNSSLQNGRKPILELRNSAPAQIVNSTVVNSNSKEFRSPESEDV